MNEVKEISVTESLVSLKEEKAVFLDIRDSNSFDQGHIPGAINLNDGNIESFLKSADKNKTTIVYCYHGISSLGAGAYFKDQGFIDVYSLAGGFEAWSAEAV